MGEWTDGWMGEYVCTPVAAWVGARPSVVLRLNEFTPGRIGPQ